MTYISAFRCSTGVVLCADTQETVEDQKEYAEKLTVVENYKYPLAIGGAGLGEATEALAQEISERVVAQKPVTIKELRSVIKASIDRIYAEDVPISAWSKQYRTAQYLIAAKPKNDNFVIFKIVGRRIWQVQDYEIIGYATALNKALLKRLYRSGLSMQQAVMLAVYLVATSKDIDAFVGGETRVAVVTENGAVFDDPAYIKHSEGRVREFLRETDAFLLDAVDGSLRPSEFGEKLSAFSERILQGRDEYVRWSARHSLSRAFNDPTYEGDPYPKEFLGCVTLLKGDGTVTVREETPEEVERRKRIYEDTKQACNQLECAKFNNMIAGREVLHRGEEEIHIRGTTGPVPDASSSETS